MVARRLVFLRRDFSAAHRIWVVQLLVISAFLCALPAMPAQSQMLGVRAAAVTRSPKIVIADAIPEASRRFHVPASWLRAIMRAESGGDANSVSEKGAIGLMQVMPKTYAELQIKHGFGGDPFDPHDNILAGAAYLAEMFDRYGSPGFLAAYNAGPQRYEEYLLRGRPLPAETTDYVARLAPVLGFANIPTARISAPTDSHRAPMFITAAVLKQATEATATGGVNGVGRSQKAAPHLLFPAPRADKIFARELHSEGASNAQSPADSLQTANLFVARAKLEPSP